jgi:hypothetical protein
LKKRKASIMFKTNQLLAILLSALAITAAQANGVPQIGGKVGYEPPYVAGTKSIAQVRAELQAYQANPASADGVKFVGGEVGYVYPSAHRLGFTDGKLVHNDALAHNTPRPNWKKTQEERREFIEHYVN